MEFTEIILIVIFVVIGIVLLWAIKNGNNIKFKKKEKKKKEKKTNEFKDVVPAEKPEKKPKEKVRKTVKDEKSGKAAPPTNKVVKVTKEDFSNSDLAVPKSMEEKIDIQQQDEKLKSEFDKKFDDDFDLEKEMRALGINIPNDVGTVDGALADDFLSPMAGDAPNGFGVDNFTDFDFGDEFGDVPFGKDDIFELKTGPDKPVKEGKFENESLEQRFSKVFGEANLADSTTKEIVVGSVMLGNRARTNREARERRNKWLK